LKASHRVPNSSGKPPNWTGAAAEPFWRRGQGYSREQQAYRRPAETTGNLTLVKASDFHRHEREKTMALYLISYDIPKDKEADYQPLWDYLKLQGAKRVLLSQWAVESTSEEAVFQQIVALLSSGDRLLVQEITKTARGRNLLEADFQMPLQRAR
jgi:hypothetical protein